MAHSSTEPSRHEVWKMFDTISSTYDRVNRCMTFGLDKKWRKKASSLLPMGYNLSILDCATGTGDQILSLLQNNPHIAHITGIDLSEEMLKVAKKKLLSRSDNNRITLQQASILAIPHADQSFDAITLSFGIRNVTDVSICLRELFRVLKPGGRALILETSLPSSHIMRFGHKLYMQYILPKLGGLLSNHRSSYEYLQQTASSFPCGKAFAALLYEAQFSSVVIHPLCGGVVSIYQADKPL